MLSRRRTLAFALTLAAPAAAVRAQAGGTQAAMQYVSGLIAEGLNSLLGKDIPAAERARRFHQFLDRHLDRPGLPQTVLGYYWNRLNLGQRQEYLKLFDDYLVVAYTDQLAAFPANSQVKVIDAAAAEGKVVVHSESAAPGDEAVRVDWFVVPGPDGSGFRVADVVAAGVSARDTLHADFTGLIRQNGGSVDALLAALRKKTGGQN